MARIVAKNNAGKKGFYNAKIKSIEDQIPDITNLATKASLNVKINEVIGEIASITNSTTTAALTTDENKILNVRRDLVKKAECDIKISEMENKYFLLFMVVISSRVIHLMQR